MKNAYLVPKTSKNTSNKNIEYPPKTGKFILNQIKTFLKG
jgi:hypothetical protein